MPGVMSGLQARCCCCSAPAKASWTGRSFGRMCSPITSFPTKHGKRLHSSSITSTARGGPLRVGCSSARASRDPDRVSVLSADEAALQPADSISPQQQPQQQQQREGAQATAHDSSSSSQASATTAATSTISSSSLSSSQHSGDSSAGDYSKEFGVSAQQLRQLVQAGVDDSQGDAAAGIMQALAQQLQEKRARKHHKHAHTAQDGQAVGSSSGGSLGSGVFPTASVTNGNGKAAAAVDAPITKSSSLAGLPRSLASALGSSLSSGLPGTAADSAARVAAFGSNSLAAAATSNFWQLLLEAASDSTLMLLMAAGAVSLGLSASTGKEAVDYIDGVAILASVAICVTVTAVTNYQKEAKFRQLNSLKENIPVSAGRVVWLKLC